MQNIYDRIKAVAGEQGFTLVSLSEKMGITRQALNAAMKSPSYPTLIKLSEALNVPMWRLFASPEEICGDVVEGTTTASCPHCGKLITIKTIIE